MLALLVAGTAPAHGAWTHDFEDAAAAAPVWTARGARAAVTGGVLHLEANAGGGVGVAVPASARLPHAEALALRVRAEVSTPLVVTFAVRGRSARFWQSVDVAAGHWQELSIPLRHCRWNHPAVPTWEDVDRFELVLPGGGAVEVDRLALVPGTVPRAAYLSTSEIAEIAFGDRWLASSRRFERSPFVVLSDAPELDGRELLAALGATYERVRRELPSLHPPRRPVVLVVFATEPSYRAFWPRLLDRFGHAAPGGSEAGMAAMGVAATWYRPPPLMLGIAVHEATHALTTQMLGLAGGASWLFEGVATRYELDHAPYDVDARVRREAARGFLPLDVLVAGGPTPGDGYLPAALLVEWLLADPLRRAQLPGLLEAMRERGDTDLRPLAQRHLGLGMAALEHAWLAWIAARWGGSG